MLNKDQIEAIETRLMGIITSSSSDLPAVFEAVRALNDCRYLQENPVAPRPATPDPCVKEEAEEKCADPFEETFKPVSADHIIGVVERVLYTVSDTNLGLLAGASKLGLAALGLDKFIKCYKPFGPIQQSSEGHYVVSFAGGNNGTNNWPGYLTQLIAVLNAFKTLGYDAWLIDLKNDCPDDVHIVRIGVRELKK